MHVWQGIFSVVCFEVCAWYVLSYIFLDQLSPATISTWFMVGHSTLLRRRIKQQHALLNFGFSEKFISSWQPETPCFCLHSSHIITQISQCNMFKTITCQAYLLCHIVFLRSRFLTCYHRLEIKSANEKKWIEHNFYLFIYFSINECCQSAW